MVKKISLIITILFLVFPNSIFAQAAPYQNPDGETSESVGPRKQVATIVFAGLAGAVLGLSTLSFYGRPQDKLSNIAIGFAIGVIAGASFTTYKAATKPREFYDGRLIEGESWQRLAQLEPISTNAMPLGAGFSWDF